jgi:ADP-dependent NAD(P)H-hydrate dehydratase / NAD(P)H-hydrate epimerase
MPVPVISRAQMRQWETLTWAAKRTPFEVISRVGHVLTSHVRSLTRPGDSVLVVAGKGHNGDDARQVSQNLTDREVTLINAHDSTTGLREFTSAGSLPQALILDGIFGIGLHGPLDANWRRLIRAINNSRIPVLAVDVPSGLDADTGEPQGDAIRASVTVTLGAPKIGLLASPARPYVGRLEVAPDIGLVPCPHSADLLWTVPDDFQHYPPPRPVDGHKGSFGHLVIVAGSLGYHGAAVLAARAAQRAHPGLITLLVPQQIYTPVASQLQSVMVQPWQGPFPLPKTTTALLFGPGLASDSLPLDLKEWLIRLWHDSPAAVIADASGLDWLPPKPAPDRRLRVVTPHPGEAARLLNTTSAQIQKDRPAAVMALSKRCSQTWVVLKGHQTAIGHHPGPVFINCSGNPSLAQGGSGDALAGFLAGLLAQPLLQTDPLTALRYGVWRHGQAADRLHHTRPHWTIEELIDHLGNPGTSDRRNPL